MNKSYSRINWENYPSEVTPLNEANLNKIDYAVNEVDNRVITLDTTKLDKTTANDLVKTVAYDNSNGIFTITYLNGSTATIDTKLEKLAVNFTYDSANERLIITLDDGTEQYVDLSSLITEYEFENTSAISFVVEDGKVKANINNGSVTGDMMQPNYLADVTVQAGIAQQGANNAEVSADAAEAAAVRAEAAAEHAEEVTDVQVMTPTTNGIGKPDDVTIGVSNGTFSTKFKHYTSLADIGLTAPVTCLEVATAMPDNSRIVLHNNNVSDKPADIDLGTVVIERLNSSRVQAIFYKSSTVGAPDVRYRMIRVVENWVSEWEKSLTTSNLTNNLLATVPGTALDAVQGKALDDKITTVNSKLPIIDAAATAKDNLLMVDTSNRYGDDNKTRFFGSPANNSPVTGTFIGEWSCHWRNSSHILVELLEFYPIHGRRWTNFYNVSAWSGWTSITPQ